jgi:phospholipase C
VAVRTPGLRIQMGIAGVAVSLALSGVIGPATGAQPGKSAADLVLPAGPQAASVLDVSELDRSGAVATGPVGINKLKHIVVIMQENRSFDHYFGTYPGADGIRKKDGQFIPCLKVPNQTYCIRPYHDKGPLDAGGAHHVPDAIADIDGGKMDGFVRQVLAKPHWPCPTTHDAHCTPGTHVPDIMGFKNRSDIPNYWAYADQFVLQDRMFVPNLSWSLPAHLAMVSGWVARCKNSDPATCVDNVKEPMFNHNYTTPDPDYAWTDLTWLLKHAGVSWAYYVANGSQPDCYDGDAVCPPRTQSAKTPTMWNPLPYFDTVKQDGQVNNVKRLKAFYNAAANDRLPQVSWIIPNGTNSEHAPGLISTGQAYVTGLVNAIMKSPAWDSTAIFISWDEWGGDYDHVVPPVVDGNGYGLRVPGLLISPYAKQGYIDHQTLSFDAYLKFIEDRFLGGARIDPATDGRPDPRPHVRENAAILGDLRNEFDFTQTPRPPVFLDPWP